MKISIRRRAMLALGPMTLDDGDVLPAWFDPLLSRDPVNFKPGAGLATHYGVDSSLTITGRDFADPNGIFDLFTSCTDGSGWIDEDFNQFVDRANAEPEPAIRIRKLAARGQFLLR